MLTEAGAWVADDADIMCILGTAFAKSSTVEGAMSAMAGLLVSFLSIKGRKTFSVSIEEEIVYEKTLGSTDSVEKELVRVENILLQLVNKYSGVLQQ